MGTFHAQNVGIKTQSPERNLDVNGNLKVSTLTNKTSDGLYRKILTANVDNGDVDYISFPSINQNEIRNVEISRSIYLGSTPNNSKECSCGDITFYLNTNNTAYFKLRNTKVFTSNNSASSISLAYGLKRWIGTEYQYSDIYNKTFTSTNYNTYQTLDNITFSTNTTTRIYTIVLPNQNNMYRLTASVLKNTSTLNIYSLICEKFYTQSI